MLPAAVAICLSTTTTSTVLDPCVYDDFNDNEVSTTWTLQEDQPINLTLIEQNNRLEVLSQRGGSLTDDALLISTGADGWRVSTDHDFAIAVEYHFLSYGASTAGGAIGLTLGVGADLQGTQSAAVGFGYVDTGLTVNQQLMVETRGVTGVTGSTYLGEGAGVGTFWIEYDHTNDVLTLGDGVDQTILAGVVQGQWQADGLYVAFGARGGGFDLMSGDAWIDHMRVIPCEFETLAVPEPASLGLLSVGAVLCLRRRR